MTFHRFFAGKGGVGKTTCAAAAAVASAEKGRRVLAVSLDPAHSLGDAFARKIGPKPARIPTRRGRLDAVELDADAALARWFRTRRAAVARIFERGTYLDAEDVDRLLGLSVPGVDELGCLRALFALAERTTPHEVVVDTAPTGHTLRLLDTPESLSRMAAVLDEMLSKHRFLSMRLAGAYRTDASDGFVEDLAADAERIAALLRDPSRTRFTWVTSAEALAVEETRDGVRALEDDGLEVDEIVVDRITPVPETPCARCANAIAAERAAIRALEPVLAGRRLRLVDASPVEPRGVDALRAVGRDLSRARRPSAARVRAPKRGAMPKGDGLSRFRASVRDARLLFFGGKGGVGKTTAAAAAAIALAEGSPARKVLLLSVDPAHSLGDVFAARIGDAERAVPGAPRRMRAREIDAERVLAVHKERYQLAVADLFDALRSRARLDAAYDREVLSDLVDVAPPGLDEICAILAVVDALFPERGPPPYDVVVLDTAPTGHTLRLLAMPSAVQGWVRAILSILLEYREAVGLPEFATDLVELGRQLRELAKLLVDPVRCGFVAVARPTALARLETERLVRALRRRHVRVGALVVNGVRGADATCARCRRAAAEAAPEIARLRAIGRGAPAFEAWDVQPPPRGAGALRKWGRLWRPMAEA